MLDPTHAAQRHSRDRRIPVTLLTGFLGSGKTTLLNALVAQPSMANALVLINEFGEIGLDHKLFAASSDGEQIELTNGCICCTIRTDLARTLREAVWRFSRQGQRQFDRLVIETTGLADPAPIVHTLMTAPRVARHYRLDGIVTTLACPDAEATLERFDQALRQAAMADLLLLTQPDLADAAQKAALHRRLARLNPGAERLETHHGGIDAQRLYQLSSRLSNTHALGSARLTALPEGGRRAFSLTPPSASFSSAPFSNEPFSSGHDERIRAHGFTFEQPVRIEDFNTWCEQIAEWLGPDMLRLKGILNVKGQTHPVAVHGVQHLFHPPVPLAAWPDENRRSRLVFITLGVDRAALAASLEGLLGGRERL